MEWHISDIQSLNTIDREIGTPALAPAEYEILRRIVLETADFEFQKLLTFSENALASGAAALAARTTILVDNPMVKVGILPRLQQTFANPVFCGTETFTRPQKGKSSSQWGVQTLARRYPEGIFIVGQSQTALIELIELIEEKEIEPALIVGTPAGFIDTDVYKERLHETDVPHITISGRKGSAVVAVAIVLGLVDLAWQIYGQPQKTINK